MTDAEKGQLVSIWIVGADKNGHLPDDPRILMKICQLDDLPNINKFIDLKFIESTGSQYDANMTPTGSQHDAPDKIREEESRVERSTTAHARKRANAKNGYSKEFEQAWGLYPKRSGGNPKNRAYKAWCARIKAGASVEEIIEGVGRYSRYCEKTGKINTELVKQAATFFGPDESYLEDWVVSGAQLQTSKPPWARLPQNDDDLWSWAKKHGYSSPGTLTYSQYRSKLNGEIERRLNAH